MSQLNPRQKVFGLGLGRTGRASLAKALNQLGIRAIHVNDDQAVHRELLSRNYSSSLLERYQAIIGGIAPFWPQLDQSFPGSKFILTVRNKQDWLKERYWIAQLESDTFARLQPEEVQVIREIRGAIYGSPEFDETSFLHAYERHVANVLDYFRARPADLLVMNIAGGDGWEKLCQFLQLPQPSISFPHKNDWKTLLEWNNRVTETWTWIEQLVPSHHSFILVDDGELGITVAELCRFLKSMAVTGDHHRMMALQSPNWSGCVG